MSAYHLVESGLFARLVLDVDEALYGPMSRPWPEVRVRRISTRETNRRHVQARLAALEPGAEIVVAVGASRNYVNWGRKRYPEFEWREEHMTDEGFRAAPRRVYARRAA
jgi:hypothetical protein